MRGGVLGEDEGEYELYDVGEAEDAPELEDAGNLLVVLAGEVAEGEEDGQVEGEDFAGWRGEYLAKLSSDVRKAINIIIYQHSLLNHLPPPSKGCLFRKEYWGVSSVSLYALLE